MMGTEDILISFKEEIHKLNNNITKLLERDKMQNKRIDDLESSNKGLSAEIKNITANMYKLMGILYLTGYLIPVAVRIFR